MVRILSGGGLNASGRPTTSVQGRPGFTQPNEKAPRRGIRRLMRSDPASGVVNADISDIPYQGDQVAASLATNLAGTNDDLVFTARLPGPWGNNLTIRYLNPGSANQSLSVSVSGNAITVSLATDGAVAITSTARQIMDAVNANAAASALVKASLKSGNDGSGVVTALTATLLTGGTYGTVRKTLPPELAKAPPSPTIIGHEEDMPTQTKPSDPSAIEQQRFGDVRVRNRSTNRRISKR